MNVFTKTYKRILEILYIRKLNKKSRDSSSWKIYDTVEVKEKRKKNKYQLVKIGIEYSEISNTHTKIKKIKNSSVCRNISQLYRINKILGMVKIYKRVIDFHDRHV